MVFYFAYGSNMSRSRLCERLARTGEVLHDRRHGTLEGYRLVFDKVSSQEHWVGFANIVADASSHVEGTLNAMTPQALESLDGIELVPHHYRRITVSVRDLATGDLLQAFTYVAMPEMVRRDLKPTREYVDHLLAAHDILPPHYVETLRSVECWP